MVDHPQLNVVAGDDDRDLGNPSIRHRTIHGYRRAYRMMGEGPPILLLHGIGDSSESWVPIMPALARNHTVIAPDLLGHGQSDKPRADYSVAAFANGMRDLLDVLGFGRITIVGHSLGGGVAAQLAYQFPDRCERLVLVATGGVSREVAGLLRMMTVPWAELLLPSVQWPVGRLGVRLGVNALRVLGTDIGRDADEVQRVVAGMPDGRARFSFTRTLRSVVDWRGQVVTMLDRSYLAESVPVLLVWGAHDAIIPIDHGHLAHRAMPTSRLAIFEEAGHFPHHADPGRFVAELEEFIATTAPADYDHDHWRDLLESGPPHLRVPMEPLDEPDTPVLVG